MKHIKTLYACLFALTLHNVAWAEIYETKDAEGNTEFTDSPPSENAEEINLQQTNIVDAPPQQPQQVSQPQQVAPEQEAPVQENTPVIIRDDGGYDDGYNDLDEGETRRQEALEAANPETPHEVLDAEAPREVGDSMGQMPDEVGDFDAPAEVDAIDGGEVEGVERIPARGNGAHRN